MKRSSFSLKTKNKAPLKLPIPPAARALVLNQGRRRAFLDDLGDYLGAANGASDGVLRLYQGVYNGLSEDDISSHKLELLVGKLENLYGILEFVRGLKDEGNSFYKQCNMGLALTKYSLALKLLSFVMVGNDEDKSVFSSLVVSLNLNLGACYFKEENFDKVGQLCSAVLCYDTSNVKPYFRREVAALGLNKPELAFMDLAQSIRIDFTNREFQQKLNEVISLLGWSSDFVNDALAVTRKDKMFRDYAKIGKEEEKRKLRKKGERKERDGCVRRCIGVKDVTKKEKDVAGKSLNSEEGKVNPIDQDRRPNIIDNNSNLKSTSETKNPNLTGSSYRFCNQKRIYSYLHLTPTMYGAISKGRTLHYYYSSKNDFISIRVLDPPKKMDCVETQEVFTPMEISHPPVKGHDRCEATPNLAQDDSTIGMVDQVSSCESTSVPLAVAPVYSPLKSAASPNNLSSQNLKLLDKWLKKESVLSHRTPMASE
uniref:Uncharacterized protein n=1 Tax=Chenopodium quinoa TaxID=63459 RepID=A0A803N401_CHEQI